MDINIFTPCVQFCDVLSFLARSLLFQIFSFPGSMTKEPHWSLPSRLADHLLLYMKWLTRGSLHPPQSFCLMDGFQCLLGVGVLCVHVLVYVNAGVHMPQHMCGDENTNWVLVLTFHLA